VKSKAAFQPAGGIVLFGGSFNPIHRGHVALCRSAYQAVHPQKIILIPTMPFYKPEDKLASAEDRLEMCRLAVQGLPFMSVSDYELKKNPPCHTIDTLSAMQKNFPKQQLYLLLGTDAFLSFDTWRQWKLCGKIAILLVGARQSEDITILRFQQCRLAQYGIRSILLENKPVPLSATEIRSAFSIKTAALQLEPEVLRYIQKQRLYGWKT
jgi:nicotinate-nucleotide adenylyltransferase